MNKGYISIIFLVVLMTIISITNSFYYKINSNFSSIAYLNELNDNLRNEIILINNIKCKIGNLDYDNYEIDINETSYSVEYVNDTIVVQSEKLSYLISLKNEEIIDFKIN